MWKAMTLGETEFWEVPQDLQFHNPYLRANVSQLTPDTWTLDNLNLKRTRSKFVFLSGHFVTNFTLDSSTPNNLNLFWFYLKVRVIWSQLYFHISKP